MRLQLRCWAPARFWLVVGLLLGVSDAARAEHMPQNPTGEVAVRGNYWRDRNTRVLNPTVDVRQELANGVGLGAHYLLDAITSASIAAGAASDMPFTELRHEAGFNIGVPLPEKHRILASYNYSTESDYWSHQLGLRGIANLMQDNATLLFGLDYGHNTVGKRIGPTGALLQGVLHTIHLAAAYTQVLSRRSLITASYEVTFARGFMNNPYRPVFVSGPGGPERRELENLPTFRVRHVLAASGNVMLPTSSTLIPHVTLRPGLRVHADSWGMFAFNPEIATYVPVGPTEFRLLLGYYNQQAANFYRADGDCVPGHFTDNPAYCGGPVPWGTLNNGTPSDGYVYTSDVKLGAYSTVNWELQWKWRLTFLRPYGLVGERLSRVAVELAGGMWFADRAVGWQYGIPFASNDSAAPAGCSLQCGAGYAHLGFYIPL